MFLHREWNQILKYKIEVWEPILKGPREGNPRLHQNICLIFTDTEQTSALAYVIKMFFCPFGGLGGGGTPKHCQNNCLLNIYWYKKKTGASA